MKQNKRDKKFKRKNLIVRLWFVEYGLSKMKTVFHIQQKYYAPLIHKMCSKFEN